MLNKLSSDVEGVFMDVQDVNSEEKIEANPSEPKYVHTKWGVGYYYNQK